MLQVTAGYALAMGCALIVIIGDTLIKMAADNGHTITSPHLAAGCALYAVSAIAWFWAMQYVTLAQGAVAFGMFSLIALAVIGAVMFKEPIQTRELLGMICAILAMLLMIRVA